MHIIGLVLLLQIAISTAALNYADILFVILSQHHPYHTSLADRLKREIITQALEEEHRKPEVVTTHARGSWTVLPLLSQLAEDHSTSAKWVFFCDQHITVRLPHLREILIDYDPKEEIWIGHGLKDVEPTIIHHFSLATEEYDFTYPNFASGFAMSMALLRTLHHRFKENESTSHTEFSIDPAFELATFVYDNGQGSQLTHSDEFCIVSSKTCATYPKSHEACGDPVPKESFFFAVKTYHEFHKVRVPVVKKTWGRFASNLMFFSDKNDTSIPTMDLGIENTERGHCAKTMGILSYLSNYLKSQPHIKWVVIADDDTILSVSRLCEVLSCYGNKNVALGERYGYDILNGKGYDYLTGGGSLVLSVDLLPRLIECACPSPSSPDDMWLGVCLASIKVPVIHSPLFHQARPIDYSSEYLAPHRPISFHKHWMIDPVQVYKDWFERDDLKFLRNMVQDTIRHKEL